MKRILCFGDSLTHGTMPVASGEPAQRYDETKRWTGILQSSLKDSAVILEEGLPSRTIDLDDTRPNKEGRNGSAYLWACVSSHVPLDVIILWLGTNDTKDMFAKTAEEITESLRQLLVKLQRTLQESSGACRIIIMSPPQMNPDAEGAKQWYSGAQPKLAALPDMYSQLANEQGIEFIDFYSLLGLPKTLDGIHLSEMQNQQVAEEIEHHLIKLGIVS